MQVERAALGVLRIGAPTETVIAMAAGDIAGCTSGYKDEATAALIQQQPTALVFPVGDLAYPDGTPAEFNCYNASWGAFKGRTYPAVGNHEYHQPNAQPYFDYWNGAGVDSGRAGHRSRGYYAFDYGAWRVIVLNSQLNVSAQTTWLQAELAANPRQCTLAVWHRPFYSSNNGSTLSPSIQKWWQALLAAKAEIVLGGSHHYYERFALQNATAGATATGVRQFVVGTGGAGVGSPAITPRVNSQKLIIKTHGVLRLTLAPGTYSYRFDRIDGVTLDAGETPCTGSGTPPPPSVSKINLTATGREDATLQYMTLDWVGADGTNVDVFRNGTRITVTANDGHYTNTRTFHGSITYIYKVCEAGTALCSNEATVTFGAGSPQNAPPLVDFSSTCDDRTCVFTDLSTDGDGSVTGRAWSFGDGASSATRNPSHTYVANGSYEVTLVATDDDGATATAKKTLVVAESPNSPPTANFSASCSGFTCTFTDSSTDPDGSVTAWSWTFGDGATATDRNPSHSYAVEGPFEVTLVATDDDGATATSTQTVTVTPPPPNASPVAGFTFSCNGLTCMFTDQSTDSDGSVTQWSWTFGDGSTATIRNPSHTYATAGPYEVTLVAIDDDGATGTSTQTVTATPPPPNAPPAAGFTSGCVQLTCTFADQSTDSDGSVTQWSWTFGDGSTATIRNPSHTYATAGPYEVTLIATDDDGATATSAQTVTVTAPPPNAPPVAGFTSSCAGLSCTFTDQSTDSDGSVTQWSWTFGDGSTATTRNPSRTYAAGGSFTVTLVATDNVGATGSVTKQVTVSGAAIVLTVTGRKDATTHYMTLNWTGARGSGVDVYRNGAFRLNTPNDGHYTNTRTFTGAATYAYKVCETGTAVCSNTATVSF